MRRCPCGRALMGRSLFCRMCREQARNRRRAAERKADRHEARLAINPERCVAVILAAQLQERNRTRWVSHR